LPPGVGPVEKFADVSHTPQGQFLEGGAFDSQGNLWAAMARLGGIVQIDPRGIILGFVPVPNGDLLTTNFAFGGPDNQYIYLEGATSGTFWRFQAPYPRSDRAGRRAAPGAAVSRWAS
jgi:sugar lactone lactonase YvrE